VLESGDRAAGQPILDKAVARFDKILEREPKNAYTREMLARALWTRGDNLSRLGRHDESAADLERAYEMATGTLRDCIQLCRALALARRGRLVEARQSAAGVNTEALTASNMLGPGGVARDLAALHALYARALRDTDPDQSAREAQLAATLLRQAMEEGAFPGRRVFQFLVEAEPDFEAIRDRQDFRGLQESLERRLGR
jgi:tetratricopeptide (TPR) repeat protein